MRNTTKEFAVNLSRETIRCWLLAENLGPKQHHGHHHRRRSKRKPSESCPAFRKPPSSMDLRAVLYAHHYRNVGNDSTVSLHGIRCQLVPSRRTGGPTATDIDAQGWFEGSGEHSIPGQVEPAPPPARSTPSRKDCPVNALRHLGFAGGGMTEPLGCDRKTFSLRIRRCPTEQSTTPVVRAQTSLALPALRSL